MVTVVLATQAVFNLKVMVYLELFFYIVYNYHRYLISGRCKVERAIIDG